MQSGHFPTECEWNSPENFCTKTKSIELNWQQTGNYPFIQRQNFSLQISPTFEPTKNEVFWIFKHLLEFSIKFKEKKCNSKSLDSFF